MTLTTNVNQHKLVTIRKNDGSQETTVYKNGQVKYVCDFMQDAYAYAIRRN